MVVIIAGCDGTGKSTCFDKLRKSMNANFIKESYTKNEHEKLIRSLYIMFKSDDKSDLTIYDRATILDDLVYQKVICNKESQLPLLVGFKDLSNTLNSCVIIYFDLDNFELTKRLSNRGDNYISIDQINEIKKSYDYVFNLFNVDPIRVNVTELSEDDVYEKVRRIIENERSKNC